VPAEMAEKEKKTVEMKQRKQGSRRNTSKMRFEILIFLMTKMIKLHKIFEIFI